MVSTLSDGKYTRKAIRVKMHNRDLSLMTHIRDTLGVGRVLPVPNIEYGIFIASTRSTHYTHSTCSTCSTCSTRREMSIKVKRIKG